MGGRGVGNSGGRECTSVCIHKSQVARTACVHMHTSARVCMSVYVHAYLAAARSVPESARTAVSHAVTCDH